MLPLERAIIWSTKFNIHTTTKEVLLIPSCGSILWKKLSRRLIVPMPLCNWKILLLSHFLLAALVLRKISRRRSPMLNIATTKTNSPRTDLDNHTLGTTRIHSALMGLVRQLLRFSTALTRLQNIVQRKKESTTRTRVVTTIGPDTRHSDFISIRNETVGE